MKVILLAQSIKNFSEAIKPMFSFCPEDTIGVENKKLKITTEYDGKPAPEVHWYRNDKEIFSGKHQWIETTENKSTLTIVEFREGDEGDFKAGCQINFLLKNTILWLI